MKILAFLRSIVVTIFFPFTVVILGPTAIVLHFLLHNRKVDDRMVMVWGQVCCWMSGVKVLVSGYENIPRDRGSLMLFNHSSFFDVFSIAGYVRGVRFGAKSELFKIPIFGKTMAAMGTLPIERKKREEVFKIYEEAKVRFERGEKFALAPEGGRFYGPQLSPFKSGPFQFALSAGVPVVPAVITGAYEALPKSNVLFNPYRWRQVVRIQILPAIETTNYTPVNRHELIQKVYDQMNPLWKASFGKS